MDAILKSGTDTVLEFEVVNGSHIYILKEDGAAKGCRVPLDEMCEVPRQRFVS
jgi:hypothetical protein